MADEQSKLLSSEPNNAAMLQAVQNAVVAINTVAFPVQSAAEVVIDAASSGSNTIIAGISGKIIKVYSLFLIVTSPVTIKFFNGTVGLTGTMSFTAAGEGLFLDLRSLPWFTTGAGNAFNMTLGSAVQVSGRAYYTAT